MGFLAVALGLGLVQAGTKAMASPVSIGHNLFLALAIIGYLPAIFAGVWLTADCLSEEKREGTLGLLFLADLSGLDIVLGKMVAQGLKPLYGMMAAVPAPALGFFIGGVTMRDYAALLMTVANLLFFSIALGLLVSALSRVGVRAVTGTLVAVVVLALALPDLGGILAEAAPHSRSPTLFTLLSFLCFFASPTSGWLVAIQPVLPNFGWGQLPGTFWCFLLATHGLGWLMVIAAGSILPHAWQHHAAALNLPLPRRLPAWLGPEFWAGWRTEFGWRRQAIQRPELWLAERRQPLSLFFWSAIALVAFFWVMLVTFEMQPTQLGGKAMLAWSFLAVTLLHLAFHIEIAIHACRTFAEDRRQGVLELLLTSPLAEDDIVRGRLLGLKRQFAPLFLLLLAADILCWLSVWVPQSNMEWDVLGGSTLVLVTFVALQLVLAYALSCWGLWLGLATGKPGLALRGTLLRVLAFPWICSVFGLPILVNLGSQRVPGATAVVSLCMVVTTFAIPSECIARAVGRLQDDFRATVAEAGVSTRVPRRWWPWARLRAWWQSEPWT